MEKKRLLLKNYNRFPAALTVKILRCAFQGNICGSKPSYLDGLRENPRLL